MWVYFDSRFVLIIFTKYFAQLLNLILEISAAFLM